MCIGIVSATQYCQYACGRQPGKLIHSWCICILLYLIWKCMHVMMIVIEIFIVNVYVVLGSIVVSISACHAEDLGSIPGRGVPLFFFFWLENSTH